MYYISSFSTPDSHPLPPSDWISCTRSDDAGPDDPLFPWDWAGKRWIWGWGGSRGRMTHYLVFGSLGRILGPPYKIIHFIFFTLFLQRGDAVNLDPDHH